ncbi:MAG: DnaB-like helicase N-terminal domain-containing protein, partial [Pseudomonadota bacterium]
MDGQPDIAHTERLPFNLEAEQALLGALLYDNELLFKVSSFLEPEHFYDPVHGR